MFQRVDIQLTEEICSCTPRNVQWIVVLDASGTKPSLRLECRDCKTILQVPHDKFLARIIVTPRVIEPSVESPKETIKEDKKSPVSNKDLLI